MLSKFLHTSSGWGVGISWTFMNTIWVRQSTNFYALKTLHWNFFGCQMHTYTYSSSETHIYTLSYNPIHTHTHTTYIYIHTHMRTYSHIHMQTPSHIHPTCPHTPTHMHAHTASVDRCGNWAEKVWNQRSLRGLKK